MKAIRDTRDKEAVGARLRGLREALGQPAKEFAASVGVAANTWSQWENGKRMADLIAMSRVWEMTGATLDYIFLGRGDTLPFELAQKLGIGSTATISPLPDTTRAIGKERRDAARMNREQAAAREKAAQK